ncbi:MAG TPA: hypothetical protein VKB93_13335 [Thermoanaerobaculia bacterium]|nr:hypothetical protein [Thermoanaerobaculia bacterium]
MQRAAVDPAAIALPAEGMNIRWNEPMVPARVTPGLTFPMAIEITNAGNRAWAAANSAPEYTGGQFAVRLSHRWCAQSGRDCPGFDLRHDLPASLPPGQTARIGIVVTAPSKPGSYELQFDAVQELVAWFSRRGSQRLIIPIDVQ